MSNQDLSNISIAEKPLDLSELAFKDSLQSKFFYGLFLFSSVLSSGTSFARVLKWGNNPVINTFMSFKFIKIILIIITRFFILSTVLSAAIKSIMFQYVLQFVMEDGPGKKKFDEVLSLQYRGICPRYIHGRYHCAGYEALTFDQATLL